MAYLTYTVSVTPCKLTCESEYYDLEVKQEFQGKTLFRGRVSRLCTKEDGASKSTTKDWKSLLEGTSTTLRVRGHLGEGDYISVKLKQTHVSFRFGILDEFEVLLRVARDDGLNIIKSIHDQLETFTGESS